MELHRKHKGFMHYKKTEKSFFIGIFDNAGASDDKVVRG